MMHGKAGRKLGMKTPHRKAMMANLCSSLVINNRVETTLTRAKELRRVADRMITLGKRNTLHARRHAQSVLRNRRAVKLVFDELAPRYSSRNGGYTRILKLGYRRGDSSPMAVIEYIAAEKKVETAPEEQKKELKRAAGKAKKGEKKPAGKAKKKQETSEKKAKPDEKKAKTSKAKKPPKKSKTASTKKSK